MLLGTKTRTTKWQPCPCLIYSLFSFSYSSLHYKSHFNSHLHYQKRVRKPFLLLQISHFCNCNINWINNDLGAAFIQYLFAHHGRMLHCKSNNVRQYSGSVSLIKTKSSSFCIYNSLLLLRFTVAPFLSLPMILTFFLLPSYSTLPLSRPLSFRSKLTEY